MNPVASEAMALAGRRETVDWVERNARERLHPSLRDPSYLVLSRRRKILARWLRAVGVSSPSVLDVGGRIQPYRTLIPEPIRQYVAVDILNSPLVNIRASASARPLGPTHSTSSSARKYWSTCPGPTWPLSRSTEC